MMGGVCSYWRQDIHRSTIIAVFAGTISSVKIPSAMPGRCQYNSRQRILLPPGYPILGGSFSAVNFLKYRKNRTESLPKNQIAQLGPGRSPHHLESHGTSTDSGPVPAIADLREESQAFTKPTLRAMGMALQYPLCTRSLNLEARQKGL